MQKYNKLMPGKWQRLLIIVSLIFLLVNAMPSFIGNHDVIQVEGITSQEAKQLSPYFNQLISQDYSDKLALTEGQAPDDSPQFEVYVMDPEFDPEHQHKVLRDELSEHASVSLTTKSAAPNWLISIAAQPIKLGLDLSGGALFVLEVDTQTAISEKKKSLVDAIEFAVREARATGTSVSLSNSGNIKVKYRSPQASKVKALVTDFVRKNAGLIASHKDNQIVSISYSAEQLDQLRLQFVEQALTTMRSRIEQLGITEGVIQKQGQNRIRIEIPGIKDLKQAERLIGATASLAFYQFNQFAQESNTKVINDSVFGRLSLAAKPIFTGNQISDAQMGRDEQGMPLVNLVLDSEGGSKMSAFSKRNIGNPMATIYSEFIENEAGQLQKSERVINVATIQAQLGSRFSITNLDSIQEAHELALLLRAGSLDAPVTIVEKRIINASLGEQNIKNGMLALVLGLCLTLAFMLLVYRRLGLIANIALIMNIGCLMGLMALTPNAVLTLPGIAGLVLTVGMAVDTNVLIFERIRHEREKGVPPHLSMVLGYKHAWTTILDANITTLICALVMLSIGYGPVKGFAITLTLGLLTSMFTGVALSKTLSAYVSADWLLNKKGAQS